MTQPGSPWALIALIAESYWHPRRNFRIPFCFSIHLLSKRLPVNRCRMSSNQEGLRFSAEMTLPRIVPLATPPEV
jgi:hypothetical protein